MIRGTPRKSAARSHYLSVSSTIHETKSGFQTDLPADTTFSRKEGRKEAVFASDKINSLFNYSLHFSSVDPLFVRAATAAVSPASSFLLTHPSVQTPKSRQTDRPHADFARLRSRRNLKLGRCGSHLLLLPHFTFSTRRLQLRPIRHSN